MVSVSKFAGTVSQTTGGKYCSFSDLNNIRNSTSGSWAVSSVLIQGKKETPNRPSTITGTNFNFNIPQGAEPTKVIVTYRHQKVAGSDWTSSNKHIMNIPAPTISLVGVSGFSGKGVAPTKEDFVTSTKTFNVKGKLTRSQVNSSSFGFKLDYPTNANDWNGYMRVSYVQITVEYVKSQYSFSVNKVSGGYNNEDYTIQLSISNKNMTSFNPSLTLSSPVGFSFKSSKGTGVITQNSVRSFTWNPKLSSKVGTSSINLVFTPDVTYPSGSSSYSGTFTLSESLYGTSKDYVATITERPPSEQEETEDGEEYIDTDTSKQNLIQHCTVMEEFEYTFRFTEEEYNHIFDGIIDALFLNGSNFQIYMGSTFGWQDADVVGFAPEAFDENHSVTRTLRAKEVGISEIGFFYTTSTLEHIDVCSFTFDVRPTEESLSIPYFSMLKPSEEELNRLGDGFTYVVESFIEVMSTDEYPRDWYKNNRIGVFNNAIADNVTVTEEEDPETGEIIETVTDSTDYDDLTDVEIFSNAEYWGNTVSLLNGYESLECEFTYNKDYPLYILVTGDYSEATTYEYDMGEVSFTEPCIIEKEVYKEREPNGNYPIPIQNIILTDGSTSEASIPTLDSTTPIIVYDYPLEDGYGTNDETGVRGIEVTGDIEQSDELVITGKLISTSGEVGERTVIVNNADYTVDNDSTFRLGGLGDLWGFNAAEITNLEDWELELTVNNILLEDVANINFGNIQVIIYIESLLKQDINIKVEGEDLSYYGVFIDDVVIPEGLETDTDFLNIDGTDTNDAYRQNIREKEIELTLSLGECDLQTSTDMLRQLAKLLVNEKDSYNRPIPKRIEFSHYPDVYFEYIMRDAFDVDAESSYYNVKVKLVIPSGTAYSKETTTTNITGYVQGLAAISPVISFKPQASVIEINELVSSQRFSMGYSGDWQSKIVELDCANRIAYLKTNEDDTQPIDISQYVDFNSDWFALKGEYSFSGTNCVIRRVEYTERW